MGRNANENKTAETALVASLQQKNKEALETLYQQYSAALYQVVLRVTGRQEIAEEALQDAFLKIWNSADKYDPQKGRLFTWMLRIARNTAVDALRSSQAKKSAKTDSITDSVINNQELSTMPSVGDPGLRQVVDKMEEKSRQIIELLYFREYTQQEASDALGLPLGTVKSRTRKAISDLRRLLSEEGLLAFLFLIL
jgi:RNA polymerase sigma factor (sigma-70 family)